MALKDKIQFYDTVEKERNAALGEVAGLRVRGLWGWAARCESAGGSWVPAAPLPSPCTALTIPLLARPPAAGRDEGAGGVL